MPVSDRFCTVKALLAVLEDKFLEELLASRMYGWDEIRECEEFQSWKDINNEKIPTKNAISIPGAVVSPYNALAGKVIIIPTGTR